MTDVNDKPIRCCEYLAGKGAHVEPDERPGLMRESDVLTYTCLKTMTPVGPDDVDASPSRCQPNRPCYEKDVS